VPTGGIPWNHPPFGSEIQDGRLYGRGSCDMKSGVAALVVAAEAFAAQVQQGGAPPSGDLVVALTADEERNCLGAELLVEEPLFGGLGAALVAEPTALGLYIAEKGAFWVEVTFLGRTAHGSMPHLGANAVAAMAEFLHRWEREYRTDTPVHPLLGTPTLTLGVVQGGVKVNVVPDRCVAQLDMRTVPGLEHADLRARIAAMLDSITATRPGTRSEVRILSDRPSVSCPTDSPLALALAAATQEIAGVDPIPRGVPYCTEACIWVPRLGIHAVICGPGDPGMAHQPDECVPTAEVEAAAQIYARVAAELLL
jgi:succinyl-diaminopimelate desuccinylase